MKKNRKQGLLYLIAGGMILCFPIFRILSQDLSIPFISLLVLGFVLILIGIFDFLNVTSKEQKGLILLCTIMGPIIGIFSYFILLVILGPMLIDTLGILNTKLLAGVLSILILLVSGKYVVSYNAPEEVQPKNRKIKDIILTCICFAIAPFGFTSQLSYRGEALGPMFGGILCLLFGLYFLYQATKEEVENDE